MDGIIRLRINVEDLDDFRGWLRDVKAIKACHIDEDEENGYVKARIMAGSPHRRGRIASYNPAQIVKMHDIDSLSFGAISEQLGCSKATACDAYHNYVRWSRNLLVNRIQQLQHAGFVAGWLYTVSGNVPGLADHQNEIPAGYTVLGQLTDDIEKLVKAYVAARATAKME